MLAVMWIRTNDLKESLAQSNNASDSLVTYINDLNQRVYELPTKDYTKEMIRGLARVDSNYNALLSRVKSLNRSYKDLQSTVSLAISAGGSGTTTNIYNEIVGDTSSNEVDSLIATTFKIDDGLLNMSATTTSALRSLDYEYSVGIDKVYVDVFKGRRGTFSAVVTVDDPRVKISSPVSIVRSQPRPFFTLSAGVNGSIFLHDGAVYAAPGLGISAGIPIITLYK